MQFLGERTLRAIQGGYQSSIANWSGSDRLTLANLARTGAY